MKDLKNILAPLIQKEVRFVDTGIEIWTRSQILDISDLENEKIKCDKLLQILNSLEEDYITLVLLIKICKACPVKDDQGQLLLASEIKHYLLNYVIEEQEARNYLLQEHEKNIASYSSSSSSSYSTLYSLSSSSSLSSLESKSKEPK